MLMLILLVMLRLIMMVMLLLEYLFSPTLDMLFFLKAIRG